MKQRIKNKMDKNFKKVGLIDRWDANWMWYPKSRRTVNFHLFARKVFENDSQISRATFHISAYTDYKLFINGEHIARGPNPSTPRYQYYDTYNVRRYLEKGKNVIGIVAHDYAIGVHWHPMGSGGLIAQLEMVGRR